jgi:hypothetical protein
MTWLLMKIISWFDKPPEVDDRLRDRMREYERAKNRVDPNAVIRDDSHTPITTDVKHDDDKETFRYRPD